ncbi:FliH/SctL family protein [Aromatoleum sp.]|uniref:FliH/SctL family protein n=1 Tax=Aromatoleum sp. TaxID=2307007 RepID=UPI002FCAD02B
MSLSRHQAAGAYRRWEPQSFGGADEAAGRAEMGESALRPSAAPAAPQPDPQPQIQLPTAADLEAMYEDARREGHAAGREEGYGEGYRDGAQLAHDEAARLAALAAGLDAALTRLDEEVSEEVVGLAIELARRMVRHTLAEQPAAVLDIVRAALTQLPQGHARIHLNPADAALVARHLGEQAGHVHHSIVEDDAVSCGGCVVAGATSEIDATVETRWRRILEGLGRTDIAWQEHD